jgi:hypothetical protein
LCSLWISERANFPAKRSEFENFLHARKKKLSPWDAVIFLIGCNRVVNSEDFEADTENLLFLCDRVEEYAEKSRGDFFGSSVLSRASSRTEITTPKFGDGSGNFANFHYWEELNIIRKSKLDPFRAQQEFTQKTVDLLRIILEECAGWVGLPPGDFGIFLLGPALPSSLPCFDVKLALVYSAEKKMEKKMHVYAWTLIALMDFRMSLLRLPPESVFQENPNSENYLNCFYELLVDSEGN